MRKRRIPGMVLASVTILAALALAEQQDRYTLKVPDGLAFSEFRGYDRWQTIAVSETEGSVKAILGNPTMMSAYKEGIPEMVSLSPKAPRQ